MKKLTFVAFLGMFFCGQFAFADSRYACGNIAIDVGGPGQVSIATIPGEVQPDGSYFFFLGFSSWNIRIPEAAFDGAQIVSMPYKGLSIANPTPHGKRYAGMTVCQRVK